MLELLKTTDRWPDYCAVTELLSEAAMSPVSETIDWPDGRALYAEYGLWLGEELVGFGRLIWDGAGLPCIIDFAVAEPHATDFCCDALLEVMLNDYAECPTGGDVVLGPQGYEIDLSERVAFLSGTPERGLARKWA